MPRFEVGDIDERDGVLYITVTAFHPVPGSAVRSGPNWKYTEALYNHHWRYKDGKLLDSAGKEVTDRNEEADFVLAVVKARG